MRGDCYCPFNIKANHKLEVGEVFKEDGLLINNQVVGEVIKAVGVLIKGVGVIKEDWDLIKEDGVEAKVDGVEINIIIQIKEVGTKDRTWKAMVEIKEVGVLIKEDIV